MNRKDLKMKAHKNLKKNFFMSILIIFIFTVIINDNYNFSSIIVRKLDEAQEIKAVVFNENTKKTDLSKLREGDKDERHENNENMKGVLAPIISRLGVSTSPLYNFSYSIKQFVYDQDYKAGTYSLFIATLSFILFYAIKNVLDIGKNRFYLESRIYHKTSVMRLLFPYKVKGFIKLSYILFLKKVYEVLWSFTIIGGFIKRYEYKMIPYLLAENPTISRKEAFNLSKEMMNGNKLEAFKLDISLIGWKILGMATLGLSNLLYYNAFKEYLYAELYYTIRNKKKSTLTNKELLNDKYLFAEDTKKDIYPDDKLSFARRDFKINTNYDQKYPIRNMILLFFTAAFIGYAWEVGLHLIQDGKFVNRGTMFGPWLPIYGFGAVLILALLKPLRKNPFYFFLGAMLLAGIVEYFTSWGLEVLANKKWWDYTGNFLNLHGRICLEGLLVFGFGGSMVTYFIAPLLNSLFNRIKYRTIMIICFILVTAFGVDLIYSVQHPNTGEGITSYE